MVGFSQPTFFPDASLVNVIEDVRRQLSLGLETLVSEYQEEHLAGAFTSHEVITVATSEAVSRGARILQYWFDLDGIGPQGTKRSTYGYGCVHTARLLKSVTDILRPKNQGEN